MKKFLALVVLVMATASHGHAATMSLVTGNNFAPYTGIQLPDGGLVTEIVVAVYREMGLDTEVRFGAWENGYSDTLKDKFHATFPYQPDQVKSDEYYLSKAIIGVRQSIFVSGRGSSSFWNLSDLVEKRFCIPKNYRPNREIEALRSMDKEYFLSADTLADCFRMLDEGRVEFVPAYDLLARFTVTREIASSKGFSVLKEPLSVGSMHLLIPKSQPNAIAHRQNFDQALTALEARGELREIVARHFDIMNAGSM